MWKFYNIPKVKCGYRDGSYLMLVGGWYCVYVCIHIHIQTITVSTVYIICKTKSVLVFQMLDFHVLKVSQMDSPQLSFFGPFQQFLRSYTLFVGHFFICCPKIFLMPVYKVLMHKPLIKYNFVKNSPSSPPFSILNYTNWISK